MDASFEHVPVVPPRVLEGVPPIEPVWFERFATVASCDVADQVGRLYTMEGVEALYRPIARVVGRALTVKPWPGDGLAVHGAVSMAEDGDVLVVDARGMTGVSGAGANMLRGPRGQGLRAFVIDGALRDVDLFQEEGFPVFGRGRATHSSTKRRPGEINVPVSCGGVIVQAGDLIVADGDGIAVVPKDAIDAVWQALSAPRGVGGGGAGDADRRRRENFERAFERDGGVRAPWSSR